MSASLSAERDRLQQQVEELEQSLSVTHAELELLSSDTGDESDGDDTDEEGEQSAAGLLAQREKIQKEIQNLESALGPHSPIYVSDNDDSSCSEESDVGLPPTADSCLQLNLVYQQVIQETLDQLETLLEQNKRQQREVMIQLSGSAKEAPKEQSTSLSYDPSRLFLGRFFKPYFKDKLTGLGPPANQETKEKASRLTGCLDGRSQKHKRWESWQKTLLIHSVSRDTLRKLIQPKLSKIDYLSQKMSSAAEADRQPFRQQIDNLEEEINGLSKKSEDELLGGRFDDHDWQKIANVDFEGTRNAEDIQRFWQNFLHPAVNKSRWTKEEVDLLKEVSKKHNERDWEAIASDLGSGRSAFLCLQTFQRFVSDSLRNGSWTPAEDAQLKELVEKMRIGNFIPYTQMSYFMEGRDHCQLIYRWTQVLDPNLKKGPWTKEEDELLLKAVAQYGEKEWWRMRSEVPGRTDGACRDRYLDCLKADTKRGPFDREEEILLLRLVEKHGVGRWSKIAAEIPHRTDAQCMRIWRKLSRRHPNKRCTKSRKPAPSNGGLKTAKKRKRRQLVKIKEESTDEEEEQEEEDIVVYMDSDEEEVKMRKKAKVEKMRVEEVEDEEEEREYIVPPLKEWIPAEKVNHTFMIFQAVELPPIGDKSNVRARSTILGLCGRSVIVGPRPVIQPSQNRHSDRTMMMVSADQLRIFLSHQADKHILKGKGGRKNRCSKVTDQGLGYQLQAGVIPWIGNILIPAKTRITAADTERERGEKRQLNSTSIFLLFLQTMSVDTVGCKEVIEQSRNKVAQWAPVPDSSSVKLKTLKPKLQERTENLEQLHVLQQQKPMQLQQKQQVIVLQQALSPNKPGILLKMPINTRPKMTFPPPIFISQPSQFMLPTTPTKSRIVMCSPPSAPQKMNSPPLTAAAKPGFTQLCPAPGPSSTKTPAKRVRTKKVKVQETLISGPNGGDISTEVSGSGGASTGVDTEDDSKTTNKGRIRKPTEKAKALRDTIKEKTESKKKNTPRRQRIKIIVPQTPPSSLTNPITDLKTESLNVSSVPVDPASSDQGTSSTQDVIVAPPPPIPTNQDTASFTDSSLSDHNYVSLCPSDNSKIPSQPTKQKKKASKSRSATKKTPKAPPKKREQVSKGGEQSSQEDQSVTKTGDATGVKSDAVTVEGDAATKDGDSTGLPQDGKRVRKMTQKARELNETMAEATKKKNHSFSPFKKRPPKPHLKKETVTQKQLVAPVQQLCQESSPPKWVMTPSGMVQLGEPPPQGLRLAVKPRTPPKASGKKTSKSKLGSPPLHTLAPHPGPLITLTTTPARTLPPAFILQPVPNPISSPLPAQKAAPSSSTLQFDASLMFLEPQTEVQEWFSGQGGVDVPGAGVTLPYLPPFVSNLSMLSELLRKKKSLTKLSLQLLGQVSETQPQPKTTSKADKISKKKSSQHSEEPDSTSDQNQTADKQAAPPANSKAQDEEEEAKEEELVVVVRQLVAERFAGNPAYQLLKARFLSCFTVPALLATFKPIPENTVATVEEPEEKDEEEEEEEEEEKMKKIQERGRRRRAQKSSLQCDGSGPPANHFSGMDTQASNQARQDQTAAVQ
ncbi:snRNA-activating protein complex subunit 4 [Halichoeres trimaculatus]|uniref:snRNA-activating protein complex subunit 4 n=1 Tax=Halichoeres trimaculatus TaxID=147232 RepID=UPI003D9EC573